MAIVDYQLPANQPKPEGLTSVTNPLLPPKSLEERLAHFPEEVYDLAPESHLARFCKVLLGDAGAGQMRKRYLITRLQQVIQGSHFFDLDRFYGALFGIRRHVSEILSVDPYADTATSDQWSEEHAKDASYRSRIIQFARAIGYGATPTGMELIAESLLTVDCDVIESYSQADEGVRTYAELEALYPTYADMEGLTYNELMGIGSSTMAGDERREFLVRPHRAVTLDESYDVGRVLQRLKPADARYVIDWRGVPVHEALRVRGIASDSEFWEIITQIGRRPVGVTDPYIASGTTPIEQPRPAFASRQGEAWTYLGDLSGVVAYSDNNGNLNRIPTQRVVLRDGSFIDYDMRNALQVLRNILAGRAVSDSVLVAAPYAGPRIIGTSSPSTGLSTVYVDRVPIDMLIQTLGQIPELTPPHSDPKERYWTSPQRHLNDPTKEVIEFRLTGPRRVNYFSFITAHYPHEAQFQIYDDDTGQWDTVFTRDITDSFPAVLPAAWNGQGNPQHSVGGTNHWLTCSGKIAPRMAQRFRIVLKRISGIGPRLPATITPVSYYRIGFVPFTQTQAFVTDGGLVAYSLALQGIDVGYRVESPKDFPSDTDLIGTSTDVLGSLTHHLVRREPAASLVADTRSPWRSDAQPVHYAVVNLFMDTRTATGEGQTVDRFYVDPMTVGVHCTLYWSNDDGNPEDFDDPEEFYRDLYWTPVPRDYTLQKGYMYLPPTKAKWWKFEFTNLVPESFETLLPVTRRVKVFPGDIVRDWVISLFTGQGFEQMPAGIKTHMDVNFSPKFTDGTYIIEQKNVASITKTRPTEAVVNTDLVSSLKLAQNSFWFGFLNWQQGHYAPRFQKHQQHRYEETEVAVAFKLAFFVGLKELTPYRLDFQADNNPEVYDDFFHDSRNISPVGFTWNLDSGMLWTGTSNDSVATSKPLVSSDDVVAIQFATNQTQALQLVPDDDFRDPALVGYDWLDPDNWHRYGDASLLYQETDNTVLIKRFAQPPPRTVSRTPGMVQDMVEPVFEYRPFDVPDEEAVARAEGGIESGLLSPSTAGRIWAAVRVTADTGLTNPLFLQITNMDGVLLAEKQITLAQGQMAEDFIGYDIGNFYQPPPPIKAYAPRGLVSPPIQPVAHGDPDTEIPLPPAPPPISDSLVRIRLIQRGRSDDQFSLDTLSLFDEGIVWEFSNNGGQNFFPARGIKNNDEGVLVFPDPGNALVWRARGVRPGMAITALRIRPWYIGHKNARANGTHRGPNVSTYDQFPPISEDPMFTGWKRPIPRWWFYISRRFPILSIQGIPNSTEFARFYARHTEDDISDITDTADRLYLAVRDVEERLDFPIHPDDTPDRSGSVFNREGLETATADELPTVWKMHPPSPGGLVAPPLHPTGST
jgi:hypothetical protein